MHPVVTIMRYRVGLCSVLSWCCRDRVNHGCAHSAIYRTTSWQKQHAVGLKRLISCYGRPVILCATGTRLGSRSLILLGKKCWRVSHFCDCPRHSFTSAHKVMCFPVIILSERVFPICGPILAMHFIAFMLSGELIMIECGLIVCTYLIYAHPLLAIQ